MMQTKFKNYHNDKNILQHPYKLLCLRFYLGSLIHFYYIPIFATEKKHQFK